MLDQARWDDLCAFVREYLQTTAAASAQPWLKDFPRAAEHRWQHTLNVLKNAELILAGENADEATAHVVRAAVILHDVSMFICDHTVHGQVSADIARTYLLEHGYAPEFANQTARAVAEHGTDLGPLPPAEQEALFSWAGKVVLEADILDKLGVAAVASELLILGKRGLQLWECRDALARGRGMERAAFFKDYIWTATGRRLAAERFGFFLQFLAQLAEEVAE